MLKKFLFIFFAIMVLVSCSSGDKNTNTFYKFLAREKYMKDSEPERVFNPDSAMLIATLPDRVGNMEFVGSISDFETMTNGLGYSKRYRDRSIKTGYWADVFAFHMRHASVSPDINNDIVRSVYRIVKNDTLGSYPHSKLIGENIVIFTTPTNKTLKMNEVIFEYSELGSDVKMTGYLYFGTSMDSFYKIRISHNADMDLFSEKENFIRDFAYYYGEGMSLGDFNNFKKSKVQNPIKTERELGLKNNRRLR